MAVRIITLAITTIRLHGPRHLQEVLAMLNMYLICKRSLVIVIFTALICWLGYILNLVNQPDIYLIHWPFVDARKCLKHSEISSIDGTKSLNKHRVKRASNISMRRIGPNSIFFIETSGSGTLNTRQACAVESAAKANSDWEIHVLLLYSFYRPQPKTLRILSQYQNVKFSKINLWQFTNNTPIYPLITGGVLKKSMFRALHISYILRFATLYKWGGVYLDLDVIVVKPFNDLAKNWVAKYEDDFIGTSAIGFARDPVGKNMAAACLKNLKKTFRGYDTVNNGPGVLARVLKTMCTTEVVSKMSAATCGGIEVYGPKKFCPIPWTDRNKYFQPMTSDNDGAYMHHIWNNTARITSGSFYSTLAQQYCPRIFSSFTSHFLTILNVHTKPINV